MLQDFLGSYYLWVKALHIIAIIAWMAGLLYLPRLFVYHCGAQTGSELDTTLQTMERRLYKFIMVPAMIAVWVFGLLMIYTNPDLLKFGWMHAKLLLVVLLTGAHHMMAAHMKRFARGENKKSDKFFRIFNEVPTVIMIAVVILAIVEPF